MKRILILVGVLVSLAAAHTVLGQSEGVIGYEVKVNMHRRLPPDRQEMKNMLPEFNIHKDQLTFNAQESLYKPVEDEEDDEFSSNDGSMRMRFKRPQAEVYVDQSNSKRILLQEFMGKKYLIEDTLKIMPWKFGTETKTIAGFECRQASYFNEERKQNVVAWYTDKLRPFLGPESFNTLPGTVLQVDINEGERIITAQKVEARPLKKGELKVPSGGTKTTEKEYRKMVDEQMQKMGANGGMIIRN